MREGKAFGREEAERAQGSVMFLGMEGIQADMSSIVSANPRSLCHCSPPSGHQSLAVTCWELGAVRSMLEDSRVGEVIRSTARRSSRRRWG